MENSKNLLVIFVYAHLVTGIVGQLEELVLGGNYGSSLHNVPNLRELRGGGDESHGKKNLLEDDESGNEVDISGDSKLSTIHEFYIKNTQKRLRKTANLTSLLESMKPSPDVACEAPCKDGTIPKLLCYLECVTAKGKDEHLKALVDFLLDTASIFCKPLKTKGNYFFADETESNLTTFRNFLADANINDGTALKTARTLLSFGILGGITRHPKTPYRPLKSVVTIIDDMLNKEYEGKSYELQENPNCATASMIEALDFLTLALEKEKSLQNVFFPGLFLVNSVAKYINTKSSFRMTLLMELNRLVTGSGAGFACRTDAQKTPPELCDELGDFLMLGFPIPPIKGLTSHYISGVDPLCISPTTDDPDKGPDTDEETVWLDLDERGKGPDPGSDSTESPDTEETAEDTVWLDLDEQGNGPDSGSDSTESPDSQSGSESKESGSESKESGSESKESGSESKESGSESKESGSESKESGSESKELGSDSTEGSDSQSGSDSKESGSDSKESPDTEENKKETVWLDLDERGKGPDSGSDSKESPDSQSGSESKELGSDSTESSDSQSGSESSESKELGSDSIESPESQSGSDSQESDSQSGSDSSEGSDNGSNDGTRWLDLDERGKTPNEGPDAGTDQDTVWLDLKQQYQNPDKGPNEGPDGDTTWLDLHENDGSMGPSNKSKKKKKKRHSSKVQ